MQVLASKIKFGVGGGSGNVEYNKVSKIEAKFGMYSAVHRTKTCCDSEFL